MEFLLTRLRRGTIDRTDTVAGEKCPGAGRRERLGSCGWAFHRAHGSSCPCRRGESCVGQLGPDVPTKSAVTLSVAALGTLYARRYEENFRSHTGSDWLTSGQCAIVRRPFSRAIFVVHFRRPTSSRFFHGSSGGSMWVDSTRALTVRTCNAYSKVLDVANPVNTEQEMGPRADHLSDACKKRLAAPIEGTYHPRATLGLTRKTGVSR